MEAIATKSKKQVETHKINIRPTNQNTWISNIRKKWPLRKMSWRCEIKQRKINRRRELAKPNAEQKQKSQAWKWPYLETEKNAISERPKTGCILKKLISGGRKPWQFLVTAWPCRVRAPRCSWPQPSLHPGDVLTLCVFQTTPAG